MRIRELHLKAFGPFTDLRLVLSEPEGPGLTVIHGRNEAGKSSARRAIHDLLYGIPPRSPDDFVHRYAEMRIGARLVFDDGEALEFLRRKGVKNVFRSLDDRATIEPTRLLELIERIPEPLFDRFYGLDHRRLTEESRALLEDEGDLGRAIFGAGLGVGNLRAVLEGLDAEAAALWKSGPRATTPRINAALVEWKKIDAEIRSKSLKPVEWERQEGVVRELESKLAEVEDEVVRASAALSRLGRIRRALPALGRRQVCRERLAGMSDVPSLSEDFAERLEKLRADRRVLVFERDRAERSIQRRESELESGLPPRVLLEESDRIEGLYRRIEGDRDTRAQLPRRESELERLEGEIAELLSGLGVAREEDLEESDAKALRGAIDRAVAQGPLDERLAETRIRLERLARECRLAAGRLGFSSTPLEKLESLPFPGEITLERFASRFQDLSNQMERVREDERRLLGASGEVEEALAALSEKGRVPSEEELERRRRIRDRAWRGLRRAWLEREARGGGAGREGEVDAGTGGDLQEAADRVEEAIALADDVSDRLRIDADRVAQQANLHARQARIQRDLEAGRLTLESLGSQLVDLEREWREVWKGTGIEPRTPPEMTEWRRGLDRLLEKLAQARALQSDLDREIVSRDEVARSLAEALAAFGVTGVFLEGQPSSFAELVRAARETIGRLDEAARQRAVLRNTLVRRDDLRDRIGKMKANLDRFRRDVEGLVRICAPDLAGLDPESAAVRLHRLLVEGREQVARREEQEAALRDEVEALDAAVIRLDEIAREMERLRIEAGVSGESEIDSVLREWKAWDEASRELRAIDLSLAEISEGAGIERLEAESRGIDRDDLDRQIADLEARIERTRAERDETIRRLQSERDVLDRMDGSGAVPELAERAEAKLAEIEREARRYVEIRLAREILGREIEAYRKANEAPLLKRAGRLFESLTLGAFVGIGTDFPDPGEGSTKRSRDAGADRARLVALREDAAEVPIEGLSSGTRDQLFLALRLASLEESAGRGETMPWIADDLLVEFDDPRSRATLEVLARLARKNQILLFSHHSHIADIAREMSGVARLVELG